MRLSDKHLAMFQCRILVFPFAVSHVHSPNPPTELWLFLFPFCTPQMSLLLLPCPIDGMHICKYIHMCFVLNLNSAYDTNQTTVVSRVWFISRPVISSSIDFSENEIIPFLWLSATPLGICATFPFSASLLMDILAIENM